MPAVSNFDDAELANNRHLCKDEDWNIRITDIAEPQSKYEAAWLGAAAI